MPARPSSPGRGVALSSSGWLPNGRPYSTLGFRVNAKLLEAGVPADGHLAPLSLPPGLRPDAQYVTSPANHVIVDPLVDDMRHSPSQRTNSSYR